MKQYILALSLVLLPATFLFGNTQAVLTDSEKTTGNVLSIATSFEAVTPTPTPVSTPPPGGDEPTPSPTPQPGHLVISEFQIHGANANQDFVEIYNPTNSTIDLSGWKIRKVNSAGTEESLALISSGKSIPSHGFFLWANNQGNYDITLGADQSNGNNIGENNSLALRKPDNTTVDKVGWGNSDNQFVEGTAIFSAPGAGQSYERKAYSMSTASSMTGSDADKGNDYDSENNASDFVLRTTSQPQNSSSATEIP